MTALPAARSTRRLATACALALAATVPLALPATHAHAATGCEPVAKTPQTNSYTHWAEGVATLPCGGYYTVKLVTSAGVTLTQSSGNAYQTNITVYTNWVTCPSGTVVHTWASDTVVIQGNSYTATSTSSSTTCP
jgi:hypothetical protein